MCVVVPFPTDDVTTQCPVENVVVISWVPVTVCVVSHGYLDRECPERICGSGSLVDTLKCQHRAHRLAPLSRMTVMGAFGAWGPECLSSL